jgi:hypothetical protein
MKKIGMTHVWMLVIIPPTGYKTSNSEYMERISRLISLFAHAYFKQVPNK